MPEQDNTMLGFPCICVNQYGDVCAEEWFTGQREEVFAFLGSNPLKFRDLLGLMNFFDGAVRYHKLSFNTLLEVCSKFTRED